MEPEIKQAMKICSHSFTLQVIGGEGEGRGKELECKEDEKESKKSYLPSMSLWYT